MRKICYWSTEFYLMFLPIDYEFSHASHVKLDAYLFNGKTKSSCFKLVFDISNHYHIFIIYKEWVCVFLCEWLLKQAKSFYSTV